MSTHATPPPYLCVPVCLVNSVFVCLSSQCLSLNKQNRTQLAGCSEHLVCWYIPPCFYFDQSSITFQTPLVRIQQHLSLIPLVHLLPLLSSLLPFLPLLSLPLSNISLSTHHSYSRPPALVSIRSASKPNTSLLMNYCIANTSNQSLTCNYPRLKWCWKRDGFYYRKEKPTD